MEKILLRGLKTDIKAFVIGKPLSNAIEVIKLGKTVATINSPTELASVNSLLVDNEAGKLHT